MSDMKFPVKLHHSLAFSELFLFGSVPAAAAAAVAVDLREDVASAPAPAVAAALMAAAAAAGWQAAHLLFCTGTCVIRLEMQP